MGVQQYLIRLAAGRAAYEPLDETQQPDALPNDHIRDSVDAYTQQYDAKGRPHSAATLTLDAEQIRAKNRILETVGICEQRDRESKRAKSTGTTLGLGGLSRWQIVTSIPYAVGLTLRSVLDEWSRRIQAQVLLGSIDCSLPFVDILRRDLLASGPTEIICRSFASSAVWLVHATLMARLTSSFGTVLRRLDPTSDTAKASVRSTVSFWSRLLASLSAAGLAMVPFTVYTDLISLGIYRPYWPPWTAFIPTKPTSPFSWSRFNGYPLWTIIGPPIAYSSMMHLIDLWTQQDEGPFDELGDAERVPDPADEDVFQPFLLKSVAERKGKTWKWLAWTNRSDGRDGFEFGVWSMATDPWEIAQFILVMELISWPLRALYFRNLLASIPTILGGLSRERWNVPVRLYNNSLLNVVNKAGLCSLLSMVCDTSIWAGIWTATSLMGIERSM